MVLYAPLALTITGCGLITIRLGERSEGPQQGGLRVEIFDEFDFDELIFDELELLGGEWRQWSA